MLILFGIIFCHSFFVDEKRLSDLYVSSFEQFEKLNWTINRPTDSLINCVRDTTC